MVRFWGGGISWTICKQHAPRSRQNITPTPHRSIFTGRMLFLMPNQQCRITEGKYFVHKSQLIQPFCWLEALVP